MKGKLSLVSEVEDLFGGGFDGENVIFAGHSLGGTAALALAKKYDGSRAIGFNPGAPASKPLTEGPGRDRATSYHVMGDLVSTHVSEDAANVIRVKKDGTRFSLAGHHSSDNILKGDWSPVTADDEDAGFLSWSRSLRPDFTSTAAGITGGLIGGSGMGLAFGIAAHVKKRQIGRKNPIPGSRRSRNRR